jgi:hypothetical protein
MNFFSEEERKLTSAQKRAAANKIIKDLQKQGEKEKKEKTRSSYTKYLQKQLKFKKEKYEEQKRKQLENIRKKGVEQHKEKAKKALNIKPERVGERDSDSTALMKVGSNVGALAGGIAKSAVYGVRYLAAKKRAEKQAQDVKKKQLEKKEMGKPGRKKQSGAVSEVFSCWREELVIEVEDKSGKKEELKIVDVMKGKNKIEINPNISEDHKEIASGKKKDDEGYMANVELDQMERAIKALRKKLKRSDIQLPAWVQSKITRAADYIDTASEYLQSDEEISESVDKKKLLLMLSLKALDDKKRRKNAQLINGIIGEAVDKDSMKCNKPKAQAHGSGETGKSHVVKACEGGEEKLIRFGQLGVKGSPKKEGESDEYASRRRRFQTRHAKNIAKGKMSAAYWANKVKW